MFVPSTGLVDIKEYMEVLTKFTQEDSQKSLSLLYMEIFLMRKAVPQNRIEHYYCLACEEAAVPLSQ